MPRLTFRQIRDRLSAVAARIGVLKGCGVEPLYGCYVSYVKPQGTAGRPSWEISYPRLRAKKGGRCPNGKLTQAISHAEANMFRQRIELGELLTQQSALRARLDDVA